MTIEKGTRKTKVHTIYKNAAGKRLPGVTTITGVLEKPALMYWAHKLGLEGIDLRGYVDEKADIGTCGHEIITESLQGREIDESVYAPAILDKAQNAALSFWEAVKGAQYDILKVSGMLGEQDSVEIPMVSEQMQVGGTCDIYWRYNGILTLTDLKTGKGIYPEHLVQVCAYRGLLIEAGYPVEAVEILNIPRAQSERFERRVIHDEEIPAYTEIFEHCREIYNLKKQVGWR